MGIHDREYARQSTAEARRARWRAFRPPPATLTLLSIHLAAFGVLSVIRHDEGATLVELLALRGAASHPLALLTYALANAAPAFVAIVLLAIWIVGGRMERIAGARSFWLWYCAGCLVGGAAYLGFAQLASALATFPLSVPAGGIAAWVMALRRCRRDGAWVLLGRRGSVVRAITCGVALAVVSVFAWVGPPATGWVLAASAGGAVGVLQRPIAP